METPLSSRRITRSQALVLAASNSNNKIPISSRKNEESEMGVFKSRQRTNGGKQQQQERERSALIDITNDSPIVGLAMGKLETPSSFCKKRMMNQNSQSKQSNTPGSGEDLLRGQVKTLLQKVEEEAVLSKISLQDRPLIRMQGCFLNSPMALLAPTPANTPQISDFSVNNKNGSESFAVSPVAENFNFSQMLNEIIKEGSQQEENGETEETNVITRSLFTDFSEKLEDSDSSDCTSVLTYQGCVNKSSADEDDDASVWSVQVNASTTDEYEDDEEEDYEEDEDCEQEEEEEEKEEDEMVDENGYDGGLLDDLCEGMSKISVNGGGISTKFAGKHIRFVYNSDGEIEVEGEEEESAEESSSPSGASGVLRLKGLPTPKGKHLRFPEESN